MLRFFLLEYNHWQHSLVNSSEILPIVASVKEHEVASAIHHSSQLLNVSDCYAECRFFQSLNTVAPHSFQRHNQASACSCLIIAGIQVTIVY